MELIPIHSSELTIGKPLPYDLLDQKQKLLLGHGHIIKSIEELNALLKRTPIFRRKKSFPGLEKSTSDQNQQLIFNDMQLKIGDKLHIKQTNLIKGTSYSNKSNYSIVTLIGYLQDKSVITSMPQSFPNYGQPLIEDDQVSVRFFSGESIFSFNSFVDKVIKLPFIYLHLAFPHTISSQTIRQSKRIKTEIGTKINDDSIDAIITNISVTGAELRTSVNLGQPGSEIQMDFTVEVHGQNIPLQIQAIVRSVNVEVKKDHSAIHDLSAMYFGIEFIKLDQKQVFTLQSFIHQQLVDHPDQVT